MKAQQFDYFHSSDKHDWETPEWLFSALNEEFEFTLDVCATDETAKCKKYYTPIQNGLAQDWTDERCFMNPPYGREIVKWMSKAYSESKKGATVVCVVPVRPDAKWWQNYAMKAEIRFFRQRIKFKQGGKRSDVAPFATAIVVFKPYQYEIKMCEIKPLFS